jgi:hypothetical protein
MKIGIHSDRRHDTKPGAEMSKVDTRANEGRCLERKSHWTLTRFMKIGDTRRPPCNDLSLFFDQDLHDLKTAAPHNPRIHASVCVLAIMMCLHYSYKEQRNLWPHSNSSMPWKSHATGPRPSLMSPQCIRYYYWHIQRHCLSFRTRQGFILLIS